jgi:hypothetical protein
MHRLIAVALGWFFVVADLSLAGVEPDFPYKARVTSEQLYVRSGPGQEFYPTGRLRRGQEVEVFRHEPTGWCAIRPPEGSFTWISGRCLKPSQDGLAVVTEEGASARVGSGLSDIRDVEQVRLHKGEVVEVLEAPRGGDQKAAARSDGRDDGPWLKIAPPSGEFRWVSAQFLEPVRPEPGSVGNDAPGNRAEPRPIATPRADSPVPPVAAGKDSVAAGKDSKDPAKDSVAPGKDSADAAGAPPRARLVRPRTLSTAEFQDELDRIELELSVMVIEEPTGWSVDLLRDQTNELVDQAATAEERARTRQIANQIARFDDIRRRQAAVLAMREQSVRNGPALARLVPRDTGSEKARPQFETDGRFDGVGRLAEMPSTKPGAPHFALTNEAGEVLCYITAAPGLNLRNYLGREVGVVGSRGYMLQQHAAHIVARHIAPLDGQNLLR